MRNSYDVVILGGGIVGASVAYWLTESGSKSVAMLEREPAQGFGSTGRATGGVRAQFGHPVDIAMSRWSIAFLHELLERTGVDPLYRPNGYLFLATDEAQLRGLAEMHRIQRAAGLTEARLVDRDDVRAIAPYVAHEDVLGGSFCAIDGLVEPMRMLEGFTRAACAKGAELLLATEALGIEVEKGRVRGVRTARGTIGCASLVIATGAWSRRVAALAGVDLPISPMRRQVAGTLALPLPDDAPMVIELASGFHFRKDHTGGGGALLLWNDPDEPFGDSLAFDMRWLARLIPLAQRRVPLLARAVLSARRAWAGLYEMTPDRHPVIGGVAGIEGLFVAAGFSGHGVMHAPITGKLVAELVLDGRTHTLDVSALAPERFARGALIEEKGIL